MKKLILSLLVLVSCSTQTPKTVEAGHKIPAEDQYWNDIATKALKTSLADELSETKPTLLNQIINDAKDPILPMFWGKSYNFDSGAKKKIVEDKLIAELQAKFNIVNDNHIVHAGIEHTYGYLFSTIDTPYGFKRKRWTADTLNYGFGLDGNSLSPDAIDGGLLSNVTFFAGTLAKLDKTQLNAIKNVSNEVFTYDYAKLKTDRLEESTKDFTIITTLVKFLKKKDKEENDYLLIYSINDKRVQKEYLITAFPINEKSYKQIVDPNALGVNQKIILRYNAYLEGAGSEHKGARKLIKK